MPQTISAMPDGPEADITPMSAEPSWGEKVWGPLANWFNHVPGWVWATALGLLLLLTLVTLPIAKHLAFKAGARVAGHTKPNAEAKRDRQLLAAVLVPAVLFWLTVLIGSGRSLTAFGREDLGWRDGWDWLVPFTLDGVAVVFGGLAFRALAKRRNPDRAYRVVWIATGASAGINFFHEISGSGLGAMYLAILSLFGMLIFHELLAQFEEGTEWIQRDNPKFGLRWLTWPSNTLCAWIAWRNHPVADVGDDIRRATIAAAVEHLEQVRAKKAHEHAAKIDQPVWWMRLAPWVHAGALRAALETERTRATRSLSEVTAKVTGLTARLDQQEAQFRTERASNAEHVLQLETQNRDLRELVEKVTADSKDALRQQETRLAAETADQVAAAKAEARLTHLDDRRERSRVDRTGGAPKPGSPKAVISDEAAVQKLLAHPGDPAKNIPAGDLRVWSQKAITEEAKVGYGRAPRLLEMVTEAQRQLHPETVTGDQAANQ